MAAADLIPRQAEFCQELKHRGFAIVQSDLSRCLGSSLAFPQVARCCAPVRRKEALAWLEGLAETDPDLADFGLSDDDGLVRYQRVDFPRTVQRLDVTPAGSGALADPGAEAILGLAADLHALSLTCLTAVAQHEKLPELLSLVADRPEPLNCAKERCPARHHVLLNVFRASRLQAAFGYACSGRSQASCEQISMVGKTDAWSSSSKHKIYS